MLETVPIAPGCKRRRITIRAIQERVARHAGITREEMLRLRTRANRFSRPRAVAMYLARRLTSHSFHVIGHHFGGRHHSTVFEAVQNLEKRRGRGL